MVRMIENWVKLDGKIIDIQPGGGASEFDKIHLQVTKIENYLEYPNLFDQSGKHELDIDIPRSKTSELELKEGDQISALVRASYNQQYFAAEDHFRKVE